MGDEAPDTPRSKDLPRIAFYRALLVDDDDTTREFVEYVFAEKYIDRCQIVSVESLGEAVHLIHHQPERRIDIVLLDLGLPETQGIETFIEFRKHIKDLPVIVFTGNDDPEIRLSLIAKGAIEVIYKGSMTPLGLYQAISNGVIKGFYRMGAQKTEAIRLPESLLRDAKDAQENLRKHMDSLPPGADGGEKVRDKAQMVGLEILAELSREVGGLNASMTSLRQDIDSLKDEHDDVRSSVVDLKIDNAKDAGKTRREKLRLLGKVIAVVAAVVAGASWREALNHLLEMLR